MNTLADLGSAYLEMRSDLGQFSPVRKSTLASYLKDFLRWAADSAQVQRSDQLSVDILNAWHRYACTRRCVRSGQPMQPSSIYTYAMAIRTFLKWLRREGHVSEVLVKNFPNIAQPPRRLQLAFRHDEVRQYLENLPLLCPDDYLFRALAEFLYSSGARISEAAQLTVADVDLRGGRARVLGKGRIERILPIGRTARHFLELYLVSVRPLRLKSRTEKAFWIGPKGKQVGYYALRNRFRDSARGAYGPAVRPHVLRRSCATEMLRAGANVWAVKELLGHEQLETIEHYALLDLADLKQMHAKCHPRDNGMNDDVALPASGEK